MRKNKIELEELLRLKRAECPSDADWARFDSQLRGRLLKEAVSSSRFAFPTLRGAFSATFLFALFSVVTVSYFYQSKSIESSDDSSVEAYSPLPNIMASYAQNEFSVSGDSGEPVFVQMENLPLAMTDSSTFNIDSSSLWGGVSF